MANNPKKVKDPTEVALSAIQEALNIADAPAPGLNLERPEQKDRAERSPPARAVRPQTSTSLVNERLVRSLSLRRLRPQTRHN